MVCKNCNHECSDFAQFCANCGAAIEAPVVETPVAENAYVNQNNPYVSDAGYQQPQYQYQPQNYAPQPAPAPAANPVQTNFVQPAPAPVNPYDIPSILLNIICFFEPFLGLVLYLSWNKEYPKRAKGVGIAALISVILRVVGVFVVALLCATVFAPFIVEIFEEIMWYF